MTGHPSRLSLDLALIGSADAETTAHIAGCERCAAALKTMELEREQFLARHPRPKVVRVNKRRWIMPALAAAAAVFAVLLLRPMPETATRAKGSTSVELYVKRGSETFAFDGRVLKEGDTLLFRYTSTKTRLLVIDAEAGGRVQVVIDQTIEPGREKLAPTGVSLDGHRGRERVIALFSDEALDRAALIEALEKGEDLPDVDADQKSWQIEKDAP